MEDLILELKEDDDFCSFSDEEIREILDFIKD